MLNFCFEKAYLSHMRATRIGLEYVALSRYQTLLPRTCHRSRLARFSSCRRRRRAGRGLSGIRIQRWRVSFVSRHRWTGNEVTPISRPDGRQSARLPPPPGQVPRANLPMCAARRLPSRAVSTAPRLPSPGCRPAAAEPIGAARGSPR